MGKPKFYDASHARRSCFMKTVLKCMVGHIVLSALKNDSQSKYESELFNVMQFQNL